MPSTNLIIALVFAALFGAGLVCLALYCLYCSFRKRCLELEHWFHLLTPKQLRSPCRHCEGTGRDIREKSRSRSSQRKSRSRSRAKRGRSRHERGGNRTIEADTEWNMIGAREGRLRAGEERLQRPRPALPAAPAVQSPGVNEHYNPWQAANSQQYAQPAMYQQVYFQVPQQPYTQGVPPLESYPMPAPLPSYQAQLASSSATSMPPFQKPPRKSRIERLEPSSRSRSRQVWKDGNRVRTTDFIHIVDDYPPIVKEAIRKAAQNKEPVLSSAMSSTDSSTSTEPVEQVPRVSIPRAVPRFAEPSPFPLPQYPDPTARVWGVPTMYPSQWNHNGGPVEQARYASPYTRPGVWILSPKEIRRPRHDPSNTPPQSKAHVDQLLSKGLLTSAGNSPEPPRRQPVERRERTTRTLRRSGRSRPQDSHEQYVRSERAEVDAQHRSEVPVHPKSNGSIGCPKADSCKITSTGHRIPSYDGIPFMSPMPLPVVEEPLSDCGYTKTEKPVTVSSVSDASPHARPTA